jgi:hypothetical protein
VVTITAEQALKHGWDYLYGHDDDCPLYKPGLLRRYDSECDCCTFEWDSDTIEVLVDIIFRAIPDYEIKEG